MLELIRFVYIRHPPTQDRVILNWMKDPQYEMIPTVTAYNNGSISPAPPWRHLALTPIGTVAQIAPIASSPCNSHSRSFCIDTTGFRRSEYTGRNRNREHGPTAWTYTPHILAAQEIPRQRLINADTMDQLQSGTNQVSAIVQLAEEITHRRLLTSCCGHGWVV